MLDLTKKKNDDFMLACRREIRRLPQGAPICLRTITARAAQSRPPGYYITYDYARRAVRETRRAGNAKVLPQWAELSARVAEIERRTGLSMGEALLRELTEGAPSSFFFSPAYAFRLYYRLQGTRRAHRRSTPTKSMTTN